jgi:hypothetical protein
MRGISKAFILYFLPTISIISLMGCISITPCGSKYYGTDHVVNRDYELGIRKTTYIGEPMIKVKDYYVSKYSAKTVSPNVDLTIVHKALFGTGEHTFYALEQYNIMGTTVQGNASFHVIRILPNDPNSFLLLISESGEVGGESLFRNPTYGIYQKNWFKFKVNPSDAKFIINDIAKTDTSQGYENYELIYTGKDKDSFRITYREYSPDDFARTAFFQDLTYPSDAKVIRFKGYKVFVDEATSESITFTAEEDGMVK